MTKQAKGKAKTSKPVSKGPAINRVRIPPAEGNTSGQNRKAALALGRKLKKAGVPVMEGTRITEKERSSSRSSASRKSSKKSKEGKK